MTSKRDKRRNKKLIEKLNKAAEIINKSSRTGSANFIVCSPQFAKIIEDLDIRVQRKKKLDKINKLYGK